MKRELHVIDIRNLMHMTQEEFAKAVGIAYSTYQSREQNRTDWEYKEVIRISQLAKENGIIETIDQILPD